MRICHTNHSKVGLYVWDFFEVTGCLRNSQNGFKRLVKLSTLFSPPVRCYSIIFPPLLHLNNSVIHFHVVGKQSLACSRGADLRSEGLQGRCSVSVKINWSSIEGWVITGLVQICSLCKCCLYEERAILQLDPLPVCSQWHISASSSWALHAADPDLHLGCFHFPDTQIIDFNLFHIFLDFNYIYIYIFTSFTF